MEHLDISDPDAQRVARFFADLMLTLADDDVGGSESVDLVRTLWRGGLGIDIETLVQGVGGVAAALADQLAAERRDAGRADASAAAVWHEIVASLSQGGSTYQDGRSTGTADSS